ncbi:cysteine methyltransferase [Brachybacterium avium]|uniref:Methylated-DNA--protein-cysteine methyltransferase n=1 Tax=Brachybacterium avium TaxID=2017485 RepID=A0A220UF58_9MICO|nr:methylated-DNA--[protein]-cysteine S-methyltransferase [Brachybacterium avium]ASK66532.1 cysteine methyltransferase [Brachybacterium avium]
MTPPPVDPARSHRLLDTRLGSYVLAAGADGLVGVWRRDQKHFPQESRLGPSATGAHAVLDDAERQLQEYLAGTREEFMLPLAAEGTEFQHAVWDHLLTIPRGTTTTYGQIARALDRPRAAQAVGAAVGSNPLSIVVPCHRVVGSTGALTGYAGGIDTKQALLLLEGALLA